MKNKKKSDIVRIGLVQMAATGDVAGNLKKAADRIKVAAAEGARIVCLQELYRTPYFCRTQESRHFDLAERIPGPSTDHFCKVAKASKTVIIAPLFEKRAPGVYHNTAVVIDADGKILGKYRKMHIPDDPHFYEKFSFTPGDLGYKSFDTRFGKLGVLICWDQWYPEGARLTALTGAQILFYPTAIGWHPAEKAEYGERQHSSWETIQRSHAIANGVYVAVANRIGHEPAPEGHQGEGIQFWGQSFISDPSGQIIAKAGIEEEQILMAECDFAKIDVQRTHWPFLRDRRIDAYDNITKRYID